jgi:hypothetical protein
VVKRIWQQQNKFRSMQRAHSCVSTIVRGGGYRGIFCTSLGSWRACSVRRVTIFVAEILSGVHGHGVRRGYPVSKTASMASNSEMRIRALTTAIYLLQPQGIPSESPISAIPAHVPEFSPKPTITLRFYFPKDPREQWRSPVTQIALLYALSIFKR